MRIRLERSTITFTANGTPYTVNVPNGDITFSPTATVATTAFNTATNTWTTTVPSNLGGNKLFSALAFPVPVALPGNIGPVTWQGQVSSDTPGVNPQWKWAAAVYTSFSTDYTTLGVKPVDDDHASTYQNNDKAGTPENFKTFVTRGASGDGNNPIGNYSGNADVHCQ